MKKQGPQLPLLASQVKTNSYIMNIFLYFRSVPSILLILSYVLTDRAYKEDFIAFFNLTDMSYRN